MMVDHDERLANLYLPDLAEPDKGATDNHANSAQSKNKTKFKKAFAKANERVIQNFPNTGGSATATTKNRKLCRGKTGNRKLRRFKYLKVIQLFFNYYGTWICLTAGLEAPGFRYVESVGLWCPPPSATLREFHLQISHWLHR